MDLNKKEEEEEVTSAELTDEMKKATEMKLDIWPPCHLTTILVCSFFFAFKPTLHAAKHTERMFERILHVFFMHVFAQAGITNTQQIAGSGLEVSVCSVGRWEHQRPDAGASHFLSPRTVLHVCMCVWAKSTSNTPLAHPQLHHTMCLEQGKRCRWHHTTQVVALSQEEIKSAGFNHVTMYTLPLPRPIHGKNWQHLIPHFFFHFFFSLGFLCRFLSSLSSTPLSFSSQLWRLEKHGLWYVTSTKIGIWINICLYTQALIFV